MNSVRSAAIYCRISADTARKGLGVQRQESECRDLAEQIGWPVARVYVDNDTSAMKRKPRPEFEQLLRDVADGLIDGVICWHTDRLYRRAADLVRIVDALSSTPIRTVTSGDLDLSTASGRMNARILGAVAEGEVEHAIERMKSAHRDKAESGEWRFPRRVFGYKRGGAELEPTEAEAIKIAVHQILSGVSTSEIARRWNRDGLLTTGKSQPWDSRGVVETLRRPLYAARVVHQGNDLGIRGNWPRVLTDDEHSAIQAFLDGRATRRRKPRQWQGSGVYLCGRPEHDDDELPTMGVTKTRHGSTVYRCRAGYHNARHQEPLDAYIDSIVVGRLSRPDAGELLDRGTGPSMPALTTERDGLQARLDQLAVMFADGQIEPSQLAAGSKPLRDRIAQIDAQLATVAQRDPIAELLLTEGDMATVWTDLDPERRAKIIGLLMRVVVLPLDGLQTPELDVDRISIEWKR